jgi:hypothetical protein
MNDGIGTRRGRVRLRGVAAVAALAVAAPLAAACGGGSHPAGPGASTQPNLAVAMASYVQCMHKHGVPGLSVSHVAHPPGSLNPNGTLLIFHGYAIQGASPGSPQFESANKSCQRLLPHGTPPTAAELHQQFIQALKSARCMRAHGYPGWPDPQVVNGRVPNFIPSDMDVHSPQFQAAAKACGEGLPPGG